MLHVLHQHFQKYLADDRPPLGLCVQRHHVEPPTMKDVDAKAESILDSSLGSCLLCRTSKHSKPGGTAEAILKGKCLMLTRRN